MKKNEPPGHLSREAKQIWRKLTSEYDICDGGGLAILRAATEAFDRAEGARAKIEAEGMVIKDRFGAEKPHPLLTAERDARAAMLTALKMLNLDVEPLRNGPGRPPG